MQNFGASNQISDFLGMEAADFRRTEGTSWARGNNLCINSYGGNTDTDYYT